MVTDETDGCMWRPQTMVGILGVARPGVRLVWLGNRWQQAVSCCGLERRKDACSLMGSFWTEGRASAQGIILVAPVVLSGACF